MENNKNGRLKNIFFIATFLVLLLSNVFQFLGVFATNAERNTKVKITLENHELRIEKNEIKLKTDNDLLLEIRYNLKNYIIQQGGIYIENAK